MSVETTVKVTCDFLGCKAGQDGPLVVQFVKEEIAKGTPAPPELAKIITFDLNGTTVAFCGKLHASEFFLPAGYEVVKRLIHFPDNGKFPIEPEEEQDESL